MPRPPRIETAQSIARQCAVALAVLPAFVGTVAGQLPAGPDRLHPDAAARLARLATTADDAVTRGEAALVLGTLGATAHETAIRAVARDRELQAQMRGLVALARLGPAGSEVEFGRLLDELPPHDPRRHAAAYALGVLPDDHPTPEIDTYAERHLGGNYRRERDTIASLLGGLATAPHPSRRRVCLNILSDAAIRDDGIRALAVLTLIRTEGATADLDGASVRSAGALERWARLEVIRTTEDTIHTDTLRRLERSARRDSDPRVRAAALRVLLSERRSSVVDLADRAAKSPHPQEAAAAVEILLTLGGPDRRLDLAQQIADNESSQARTAMLDAWRGTAPETLVETAAETIADPRCDAELRLAAARLLLRVEDPRALPGLRELAERTTSADVLADTYRALLSAGHGEEVVRGVEAAATEPGARPLLAARIGALVRARHPGAADLLEAVLAEDDLDGATRTEVLVAWRRAVQPSLGGLELAALPPALLTVLH